MRPSLKIGGIELLWLNGGRFAMDGGAMFGVVPKALWSKKYPANDDNTITMVAWPILVKTPDALVLIETGLGNKLTDKQKKIFKVTEEWDLCRELESSGIKREDITHVILTHYDFDHGGGVVMHDPAGKPELTFPKAVHILQKSEWEDVQNPNRRSVNTYWKINYETLRDQGKIRIVEGDAEAVQGIRVIHTGGHNRGHQIVRIESQGESALHLADLLPTHAHFNPLWIMAYDNFPLDAIMQKESWEARGIQENSWFTFYHDPLVPACKFDEQGNITEKLAGETL